MWCPGPRARRAAARPRPRSTPAHQPAANFRRATESRIAIGTPGGVGAIGIVAIGVAAPRIAA